jgi:hypothetical protein
MGMGTARTARTNLLVSVIESRWEAATVPESDKAAGRRARQLAAPAAA